MVHGGYTVTAADVTQLALVGGNSIVIACFPSVTQPTLTSFCVGRAAGAFVSPATIEVTWLQVNTNFWAMVLDDPGAVLVATDLIGFTLIA